MGAEEGRILGSEFKDFPSKVDSVNLENDRNKSETPEPHLERDSLLQRIEEAHTNAKLRSEEELQEKPLKPGSLFESHPSGLRKPFDKNPFLNAGMLWKPSGKQLMLNKDGPLKSLCLDLKEKRTLQMIEFKNLLWLARNPLTTSIEDLPKNSGLWLRRT